MLHSHQAHPVPVLSLSCSPSATISTSAHFCALFSGSANTVLCRPRSTGAPQPPAGAIVWGDIKNKTLDRKTKPLESHCPRLSSAGPWGDHIPAIVLCRLQGTPDGQPRLPPSPASW